MRMKIQHGIMGFCLVSLMATVIADQCKAVSCVLNYELTGRYWIKRASATDYEECATACEQEQGCRSVNFFSTRKACALRKSTRHWFPEGFYYNEYSIYCEIHPFCETGWIEFQNSCYLFSSEQQKWHGARAKCESLNATLVIIKSEAENSFIARQLNGKSAWIGMTDEIQEGRWVWLDGSEVDYENFSPGEPSNADENEHYGIIWRWNQWNDAFLWRNYSYICQRH